MQTYTLSSEDKKLLDLFQREWEYNLKQSPEFSTFIGETRYNHLLSDISQTALEKSHQHDLDLLRELQEIRTDQLTGVNQLNYQLYKIRTENGIMDFEFKEHLMPVHQMYGVQNSFNRLVSMMPYKKETDYENYLGRLKAFPVYIDQTIALMDQGIKEGFTIARIAMADVANQVKRQLPDDIRDSSFFKPLVNPPHNLSEKLKDELEMAIKNELYSSLSRLKNYLEETYIPACRESIGLIEIPNGKEFYDHKLREFTTTELNAEEIHELGTKEVERIFSEIKEIMKVAGFEDYDKFLEYLRTSEDFYFKDEKTLLMNYRDFAKRVDKELPRFFKILPRLPYGIEKVPDHQAPSCPTAFYMGPDLGMTRAGIFYANTFQLETRPKYEIESLTLHEAVPGHHLQISLALELENLPQFRKMAKFTGYVEGWALYTEKLGAEMGFYEDPFAKFGQLSFEIWRACRLVIDTGLHVFNWDRQKAIDYLKFYTGKSEAACAVEVDRYIVMPGQATAYKIGELKILELRKKFEEARGENFDIREFHDVVLRNGALPLNVLEDYVLAYLNLY
jgi:uncharacterized protein (DUF885 family)